jgi:CelD/BcsL family acetyltransferase involved in cellulose biosynthesis
MTLTSARAVSVAGRPAAGSAPDLAVECFRGRTSVLGLALHWDDLSARSADSAPFLSRAWTEPWIAPGRARGRPVALTVWAGRTLVALLVVSVRRAGPVRVAVPPGSEHPSYHGVLADTSRADARAAIGLLAEECASRREFDVLRIEDVSSDDGATAAFLEAFAACGARVVRRVRNPCLTIALARPFDAFLARRHSGRTVRKLRNEERRLAASGEVTLVRLSGREITPDAMLRAAAVQRASWMERRGAAVLAGEFHRALALSAARGGLAHLWIVRVGDEDAAFGFALAHRGRVHLVWTAFRLAHEAASVGKTLVRWIVRDACEEGMGTFDFGHGDAAYKRAWATGEHEVIRVAAGRGALARAHVAICGALWDLARVGWLTAARRSALRFARSLVPARD